ncbi:MAG TPA: winged helix-turn-helix domain-containing protein [Ktedonobacteraceae bacterium]|nr:winged helix-turn-helix domain-containing protein [Ktedonobacteraceae bacterium]
MAAIQHIGAHEITRLDSVRTLLVDNRHEIKFTPTEYRLLRLLLNEQPVVDQELASSIFNGRIEDDLWAREALDRHIDNIRRKFRQHDLNLRILRIPGFGYMLVAPSVAKAS